MNRLFIPILTLISQLIWQDSFSDEKKTWKNELILQVLQVLQATMLKGSMERVFEFYPTIC